MANRTQLEQVVDGDQLSQGYFNEIGVFYVQATDSSGADHTHNAATWSLERTFTFSGLSTNYHLVALELESISLARSGGNPDTADLGIIISDGTNLYTLRRVGYFSGTPQITHPLAWESTTADNPHTFFASAGTETIDRISVPIPISMMTGATSYTVKFYLYATQNTANTATLTKGFKVRLVVCKRPQDLGTTVSQS